MMHKTDSVQLKDLFTLLEEMIWEERVSLNVYGTSNEDSYLSGINEGLDRARRVLTDFNIEGYLLKEETE